MGRYFILTFLLWAGCISLRAQVAEKLQQLGMEDIQVVTENGNTTIAFEDNIYRGTYRGIGKAIEAAMEGTERGSLQMVVLEQSIPQLCITLTEEVITGYKEKRIGMGEVYRQMGISHDTDAAMATLRKAHQTFNRQAGKIDIVVYPEVKLENSSFDRLYSYYVNLAPAVEMTLWKGAELTAQAVFPIATNLKGQYRKIRPGVIALSQECCFGKGWSGRVAAGNFTNNRMGAQAEMKYRTANGRLELGAVAGGTVQSVLTDDEGWYISRKLRMNAALKASIYEPCFNLRFDLQAARYVYGDYGVRGDCTRHFGEYAIGVYGIYTDGELNGGFHFAIPLPGKRWSRNRGVRIRQADYFSMEYSMESWGKYADGKMGETYRTRPDENRSNRFFQPEYIRYFLIKEANKQVY